MHSPLQSLDELIARARSTGWLQVAELSAHLPREMTIEQLDEIIQRLDAAGVTLVDSDAMSLNQSFTIDESVLGNASLPEYRPSPDLDEFLHINDRHCPE